jgi:hypothetical protein
MKKEIKRLAKKYGFSEETIETLLNGLIQSGGNQVQFNIFELGGMGQWQSGMVMIGDMFNNGLKNTVNNLCYELVELVRNPPAEKNKSKTEKSKKVDAPTFKGSQNETGYQYFATKNRLEILKDGKVKTKYDTSGFELTGAQQQQNNSEKDFTFQDKNGKTLSLKDFKKLK